MKRFALLTAVAVLSVCASTWASVATGPSLTIQWENVNGDGGQVAINSDVLGQYAYQRGQLTQINIGDQDCLQIMEQLQLQNSVGLDSLAFAYDPDPFVSGGLSVYNPSGVTQTYTFTFTSPVSPALVPNSLYGGSMSGSITAGTSTPATVSTAANTPLYWGMIDGTPVLPIYSDPASWTVSVPFGSGNIPAVTIATTNIGPQVLNDISLQFKFTLTPDDIVTMNGIFEVIPEPATLALLGLGSLLLRKRRV